MKTKACSDPTHKPHEGLAAGNAKLLTALQWAIKNIDPFAIELEPENYTKYHELAWGIKPIIRKAEYDDMP